MGNVSGLGFVVFALFLLQGALWLWVCEKQSVKGSPQSQLNEGLILVKLSPEHRRGVLNYGQMSCFPHLTITRFSFQLQEKGD